MDDLEITRLCATAMKYTITRANLQPFGQVWVIPTHDEQSLPSIKLYDPLHNDAQAMALVKRFWLTVICTSNPGYEIWQVKPSTESGGMLHESLNRAICQCVAVMRGARCEGREMRPKPIGRWDDIGIMM